MEQVNTGVSPKTVRIQHLKTLVARLESESEVGNPDKLLDALKQKLNLKNDSALAEALGYVPPAISKIRSRRFPITARMLIRMHEVSDLPIKDLKALAGI